MGAIAGSHNQAKQTKKRSLQIRVFSVEALIGFYKDRHFDIAFMLFKSFRSAGEVLSDRAVLFIILAVRAVAALVVFKQSPIGAFDRVIVFDHE